MCAHVCVLDFIGYVFTYIYVECFHVFFYMIFFSSLPFYSLLDLNFPYWAVFPAGALGCIAFSFPAGLQSGL